MEMGATEDSEVRQQILVPNPGISLGFLSLDLLIFCSFLSQKSCHASIDSTFISSLTLLSPLSHILSLLVCLFLIPSLSVSLTL